jgi:hypothetical protein
MKSLLLGISYLLSSITWLGDTAPSRKNSPRPFQASSTPDLGFYPGYNDFPPTLDPTKLHPVIRDFQTFIEDNAEIYMGFRQMFEQVPDTPRYQMDMAGIGPRVSSPTGIFIKWSEIDTK